MVVAGLDRYATRKMIDYVWGVSYLLKGENHSEVGFYTDSEN
ncbi:hypothetical protein [Thermococcus chitonophagus]|uniref:Uncharacterized protein n=1 Tax=Thermococcus chitonophagus TaxID=54262 RepID=A0A160VQ16_9EURY|nr:hypothetical protein [Thermococcus chitonophagus]CUX76897.1 hypothetical protein CHITON_0118 [Thermococcus chitonophagus]